MNKTSNKIRGEKYDYTFIGYSCNKNNICSAVFDSIPYSLDVILAYGNIEEDTLHVKVLSSDDEEAIETKVFQCFNNHIPKLPLPTKNEHPIYTYKFNKFVYNHATNHYEPEFITIPKTYPISFNMPSEAKLEHEIEGHTYGEQTILPNAFIENSDWNFKGWFTKENGNGKRVKILAENDLGEKEFYAHFQKTITYEINGKIGNIEINYSKDSNETIKRALNGIIPPNFNKGKKTYTFSNWELKNDIYIAKFNEITKLHLSSNLQMNLLTINRTLKITALTKGDDICVFDLRGNVIHTSTAQNSTLSIMLSQPGIYIIRINKKAQRVNVR